LGLTLFEGIQDYAGKHLVRPDPKAAVRWFRIAADRKDPTSAGALGYAYDVGIGTRRNAALAKSWYRKATKWGSSTAAANLATVYRDTGKATLALRWWRKAAAMSDGDAMVDIGYCYLYGIGTRSNPAKARRALQRAIASNNITEYRREEAMYHLAITSMDAGNARAAVSLLKAANTDADYPEAANALAQIRSAEPFVPCRCRRRINKHLRGHASCLLHPRPVRSIAR
jgi:tetratricopeptide (TPR) repeat protein